MRLNSTSFPSLLDICRTLFFASQLALKFNKPDLNDQNGKVLFSTHQSGFTQHLTSFDGSHTQSKHALKYAWISITIGYLLGSHVAIIWVVIHKKWSAFLEKNPAYLHHAENMSRFSPLSPFTTFWRSTNFHPLRLTSREIYINTWKTDICLFWVYLGLWFLGRLPELSLFINLMIPEPFRV